MTTFFRRLPPILAASLALGGFAVSTQAQVRAPGQPMTAEEAALLAAAAPPAASPDLYKDLGGRYGIAQLVTEFTQRLLRDERTHGFFVDADQDNLKLRLTEQFCVVSGGPCTYGGKDMRKVHDGQDITKADFNALVEVLQRSMDARAIPFGVQNRLLARLAPMHREVVNKQ